MMDKYILKDKEPVKTDDLIEWGQWMETGNRIVNKTTIEPSGVSVSTVFLGLDHSLMGGEPTLFETLVFGGEHDGEQDRYATWDEAEAGHRKMVDKVCS